MGGAAVPVRLNLMLAIAAMSAHLAFAVALMRDGLAAWIGAGVCLAATPGLWSLMHEGIHGHLLKSRRGSDALARAVGVAFGAPFTPLRFTHLLHHRCNRTRLDRPDVHDPADGPRWRSALGHFARLAGGQFYGELMLVPLAFAPRRMLVAVAARRFAVEPGWISRLTPWIASELLAPARLRAWRLDSLAIAAFWGLTLWFAASGWPLLALLISRALWVSTLDNAFHHGTALDVRYDIRNLRAPRPFALWLLNFNLHRAHHADPSLPWTALPHHPAAMPESADPSLLAGLLRQWRGPVAIHDLPPVPV